MSVILCPRCERAHQGEECEVVHRGRRFFLMGALALPVARKIESVAAKIVKPPPKPWPWLKLPEFPVHIVLVGSLSDGRMVKRRVVYDLETTGKWNWAL